MHLRRRQALVTDRAASQKAAEEIESKWATALALNGVEDLAGALEAQRAACDEVLRRKDALAEEFRKALKDKDNK